MANLQAPPTPSEQSTNLQAPQGDEQASQAQSLTPVPSTSADVPQNSSTRTGTLPNAGTLPDKRYEVPLMTPVLKLVKCKNLEAIGYAPVQPLSACQSHVMEPNHTIMYSKTV